MVKIGHQARLGDTTCSSYSFNHSDLSTKFVPSIHATFCRNRKHSFDVILEITKKVYFIAQKE